jgi:hypothetical protein
MGLPHGTTIPLSPLRRLMCDLLDTSRQVPLVSIERRVDLSDVLAARQAAAARPSWFAIFLKAYGIVSAAMPELRRSYLSFPWPRLHQHACTVASLAVARRVGDEEGVLQFTIREPQTKALADIDARIRRARTEPVEQFGDFRRQLRLARLPWPLRRWAWWLGLSASGEWRARYAGTFGLTGVAALGSASLNLLSPLTSTLTYGVFDPEGRTTVRLFWDHRVLDGVEPATALERLEAALRGPIAEELRAGGCRAAA